MSEEPPRFPYVAALLCAACLGAAVWTWMRYSYAWATTPEAVVSSTPTDAFDAYHTDRHPWMQMYVEIRGELHHAELAQGGFHYVLQSPDPRHPGEYVMIDTGTYRHVAVVEMCFEPGQVPEDGQTGTWRGRLRLTLMRSGIPVIGVHTAASRFHGASIAGLVVGAMGVFVFTVALRHWLRERSAAVSEALDLPDERSAP